VKLSQRNRERSMTKGLSALLSMAWIAMTAVLWLRGYEILAAVGVAMVIGFAIKSVRKLPAWVIKPITNVSLIQRFRITFLRYTEIILSFPIAGMVYILVSRSEPIVLRILLSITVGIGIFALLIGLQAFIDFYLEKHPELMERK
jgi:hypothetical protein